MENPGIDEDNIPLLHPDDDDYDNYKTPDTSRRDKTFTVPGSTDKETISTLCLRQKVKGDKLAALYRHLNVMGNLDLVNLDWFKLAADPKNNATIFEFYNIDKWFPLRKQTGKFLAPKTLRDRFGGVNAMENDLGVDEIPPGFERSFKSATNLSSELPTNIEMESIHLEKFLSLAEDVHVKTWEASQNTDLDMREFLGIDEALQNI